MMCDVDLRKMDAKVASSELARLIERQLGFGHGHIDNIALRLFLQVNWSRVSLLAHAIHEDQSETPKGASSGCVDGCEDCRRAAFRSAR